MTPAEEKEVIRVHGPDYKWNDIPAYIRKRIQKEVRDDHIRTSVMMDQMEEEREFKNK